MDGFGFFDDGSFDSDQMWQGHADSVATAELHPGTVDSSDPDFWRVPGMGGEPAEPAAMRGRKLKLDRHGYVDTNAFDPEFGWQAEGQTHFRKMKLRAKGYDVECCGDCETGQGCDGEGDNRDTIGDDWIQKHREELSWRPPLRESSAPVESTSSIVSGASDSGLRQHHISEALRHDAHLGFTRDQWRVDRSNRYEGYETGLLTSQIFDVCPGCKCGAKIVPLPPPVGMAPGPKEKISYWFSVVKHGKCAPNPPGCKVVRKCECTLIVAYKTDLLHIPRLPGADGWLPTGLIPPSIVGWVTAKGCKQAKGMRITRMDWNGNSVPIVDVYAVCSACDKLPPILGWPPPPLG